MQQSLYQKRILVTQSDTFMGPAICESLQAQIAYVQALGVEVAKHNIHVNAIAQNFVDNPSYFPEEIQANPRFQDRLRREVPLGRLVSAKV